MKGGFFNTLFFCFLASIGILIGVTFAAKHGYTVPPWVALVLALLPIAYYHLFYLLPRAKDALSQAAIDSVYYFGFLVTVAALGISAISVAISGTAVDVDTIVYQFGVGLFATGYAIIARMHLGSISPLENVSPEAILDQYVKRSLQLVDNVEAAGIRWAEFSEVVMSKTTAVSAAAKASAEASMLSVARVFEQEMQRTLAESRRELSEIRSLVSATSFATEREALLKTLKQTVAISVQLNAALNEFASRSKESAQVSESYKTSITVLDGSVKSLATTVDQFGGKQGVVTQTIAQLQSAGGAISESVASLRGTLAEMASVGAATAEVGASFKAMGANVRKASEQLDKLASASEKLEAATTRIEATAEASSSVAIEFAKVSAALPALTVRAEALGTRFERASQVVETLQRSLTSVLVPPESLDGLRQLSRVAGELGQAVGSLEKVLEGLAGTAITAQKAVGESTAELRTAMTSSARALEVDVKRSTEAVSMLTERLIQVAQGIIDQTNKRSSSKV